MRQDVKHAARGRLWSPQFLCVMWFLIWSSQFDTSACTWDDHHHVNASHFTLASTMQRTIMIQAVCGLVVTVNWHPRRDGGSPCQPTTAVTVKDTWVITPRPKYGVWEPWERRSQSQGLLYVSYPERHFLEDLCERLHTSSQLWHHVCSHSQTHHHK